MEIFEPKCEECIFRTILCKDLSREEFDTIFELSRKISYKKGEVIFKQNMKTTNLIFLTKGMVKFVYNNGGKDLIVSIDKAQTLLGLANILNEDINLFSIVAIEDCQGCTIDMIKFKNLILNNRAFSLEIMKQSTIMFRRAIFNFISIAHKNSTGRIADILIYLSETIYNSNSFSLSLSRQELSEYAGCSKELVINTMHAFAQDGIITISGKKIEILNMENLKWISKVG